MSASCESGDVRAVERGRLGLITLDRGRALNALTHAMVRDISDVLDRFEANDEVAHVAIRSSDPKAFSVGGDIRDLYERGTAAKRDGTPLPLDFFRDEYGLNHRIKTYPKPYVALIDGMVMGGGVGVSINGSHRVAGDAMQFAMPEVGIGFFPDVGATWFLPRMPARTGVMAAFTGERLGQGDCLWTGIATHAVPGERFDDVLRDLSESDRTDAVLDGHSTPRGEATLEPLESRIASLFGNGAEEACQALGNDGMESRWASAIRRHSPTSLKIAAEQMRLGAELSFAECMKLEYRVVSRVLAGHDFYEGVRAQVIDKDREPQWCPDRLSAVDAADIARYFAPVDDELAL